VRNHARRIRRNFKEELKVANKNKIREWYNGYTWDMMTRVYNPFSLLNLFVQGGEFKIFGLKAIRTLAKRKRAFYHAIIHLTFTLLRVYVQSEVQASDGRVDAFIQLPNYIYCIEFKLDKLADEAIQQIKDKGYLESFAQENKKRIIIGINFSSEKKKVEELKW
jgi:hypothetical protein